MDGQSEPSNCGCVSEPVFNDVGAGSVERMSCSCLYTSAAAGLVAGSSDQQLWISLRSLGGNLGGAGLRVQGSGFRVQGAGLRVQGSGVRLTGSGFRGQAYGFRVQWGRA